MRSAWAARLWKLEVRVLPPQLTIQARSPQIRERAAEAGQHVRAVQRLVRAEQRFAPVGAIDSGGPLLRVDHPYQAHPGLQPLSDLLERLRRMIVMRQHLDREVRRPTGIASRLDFRQTMLRDERDVRRP